MLPDPQIFQVVMPQLKVIPIGLQLIFLMYSFQFRSAFHLLILSCCIRWAICKSAPHTRQPRQHPTTQFLYRSDALPAAQPAASKHWRHSSCKSKFLPYNAILSWYMLLPWRVSVWYLSVCYSIPLLTMSILLLQPFYGPWTVSGTTRWAGTRKVKPGS